MRIAIVGIGYVGLVSAACFADLGVEVYCIDIDTKRIEGLRKGVVPIYEPGLEELVRRGIERNRLHFSTDISEILDLVEIVFIAVGTPSDIDGAADLSAVLKVAEDIGKHINRYCLIVTKSTVPVGSSKLVEERIQACLRERNVDLSFDIASNPEFLKEGNAIDDFMKPDRVVVGVNNERAKILMTKLYKPILLNNFRVIFMDIASAEMSKYAANAMLATRISFMNEIARLCECVGANINAVRLGIGSDVRIGSKFLYAGCGYGGSCFPKDVKALIHTAQSYGERLHILEQVERVNNAQKQVLMQKFRTYFDNDIIGKKVAVWGLSFKPGTDDIREAPSLYLINELLKASCQVSVYDPIAMVEVRKILGEQVRYASDIYDCSLGVDAIFHVTEWKEFRMPSWEVLARTVHYPLLIDGRNVFDDTPQQYGFTLLSVGQGTNK